MPESPSIKEALKDLVHVVSNMRVPQNTADAALQVSVTIGPSLERARAALATLSQPTADRREIVARIMVLNDPNYTIYHMPGETPRKWKASSGAVLDTSELSEDQAEKVRKRADLILAALDGGR